MSCSIQPLYKARVISRPALIVATLRDAQLLVLAWPGAELFRSLDHCRVEQTMKRKSSSLGEHSSHNSGILLPEVLRLIFFHVGPEDTILNCRRVCKDWKNISQNVKSLDEITDGQETLAKHWIDNNPLWKYDWRNDNKRIKESSSACPLWTYCFNRVTVRKFFHKCVETIKELWVIVRAPCAVQKVSSDWLAFETKFPQWKLPWELFEFYSASKELSLTDDAPFCIHFYYQLREPDVTIEEDSPWEGLSYNEIDTWKWLNIGEEAEYSNIMINCDPNHSNFGQVATAVNNCAEGTPIALSLVELMRGMYWQHTLMVKEYGIDKLRECSTSFWSGSQSRTEGDSFDYFRSIAGWTVNETGVGKKELPAIRNRFPQ